jgi:hypothetical protein
MCLEASTKPHVQQKFEIFWTNIASTMACPMSKNGPKEGLRPLGFKVWEFKEVAIGSQSYLLGNSISRIYSYLFHEIKEIIIFKHQSLFYGCFLLWTLLQS